MGIPTCCNNKILGSANEFRDIFNFPESRVFTGIMIENPSTTVRVQVAIGTDFAEDTCIDLLPGGLVTFDGQTFGSFADETAGFQMATKLRAKLSTAVGSLASGTLTFSGQPSDGQILTINGIVYEWSDDASSAPGRVRVEIGATANDSYTNLSTAIANNDPNLTAMLVGSVVTLTSNFGGTDGNAMTLSVGTTSNVIASGATFAGGSGGVTPIFHIW